MRALPAQVKEASADERAKLGRDAEDGSGRKRMQPSGALNERQAGRLGRHQSIAKAKLMAESDALGFLHEQRIGSGVDHEAVELLAEHDAAGARPSFEEHDSDALTMELVGGGQPCHPAADNDHARDHDTWRGLPRRTSMDVLREGLDVLERRGRQDAVPQVEDVPRASARAFEHIVGAGENAFERPEQPGRIEVALNGPVVPDPIPRVVQRDAPVSANDAAARLANLAQDRARADAEMDRWHVVGSERVEDAAGMGQDEFAVVAGIQRADPRVEYLDRVDAGFNLRDEVVGHQIREQPAEAMPRVGRAVHQRLGLGEAVGVTAFDRIRGERERRSRKADERHPAAERFLDLPDGLKDMRQMLAWIESPQARDVGFVLDGILDCRPFALDEIEPDSHGLEREQQVGKQDGRVDLDAADRLQRDLGGEIGRAAKLEQRVALAQTAGTHCRRWCSRTRSPASAAGRAGGFGFVVGVDRLGQAEALREHGADIVVTDLADLLEEHGMSPIRRPVHRRALDRPQAPARPRRDRPQTESVFALSNGHIGLRGNLDEGEPHATPGTYLNSFYERRPLPYAEGGYGYPESGQTIVNVTNGKLIRLLVDDEPFDVRYGQLRRHERVLDMRAGTLTREVDWSSPAGKRSGCAASGWCR